MASCQYHSVLPDLWVMLTAALRQLRSWLQVTSHVALLHKWMAADLYSREVDLLQFELSMPKCSRELWNRCKKLQQNLESADDRISSAHRHSCSRASCEQRSHTRDHMPAQLHQSMQIIRLAVKHTCTADLQAMQGF